MGVDDRLSYACRPVFAFIPSLGWQEMFLLLVIGLLLYGRNLPEAGRNLGRMVAKLKRGFDEFKSQMDRDADLRELKDTLKDTAKDLRRAGEIPRTIANPVQAMKTMAHDAMLATPADDAEGLEPAVPEQPKPPDPEQQP
jgi:Sec-independent protein translocase protein TatA